MVVEVVFGLWARGWKHTDNRSQLADKIYRLLVGSEPMIPSNLVLRLVYLEGGLGFRW